MNTVWKITYTQDGEEHTTEFVWSDDAPSKNDVAIGIREEVLHDVALIDRTSGQTDHSVALLEHHGVVITGIEKGPSSI